MSAVDLSVPHVTMIGWSDCPHLTDEMKAEFRKTVTPNMLPAREHGIPYLGAGAIYPVPLDQILEDPFPIPDFWPRAFALDVGWKWTAALWMAIDRDSDVIHIYDEHKAGQAEPVIHASSILGNGNGNLRAKWIPGVIDPAARNRAPKDGIRLMTAYKDLGLNLNIALNAVEGGIVEVWKRLTTGRLKVFSHLSSFQKEFVLYRRKEDGQIVKKNDHLMDCLRYLILSGMGIAKPVPHGPSIVQPVFGMHNSSESWMAG